MTRASITTSFGTSDDMISPAETLGAVLDRNNINPLRTPILLTGTPINPGDLEKTLPQLGYAESVIISAIIKTQNN